MARRVVKVEAKRRAKEERELKAVQSRIHGKGKNTAPVSVASTLLKGTLSSSSRRGEESMAPKMKRLFQWAIVKLYEEGSVVLWDGAIRPIRHERQDTSGLWKVNSTAAANCTVFSAISSTSLRISRVGPGNVEEDDGDISDPPKNEEAYISVTPEHLAPYVEKAISTLMGRSQPPTSLSSTGHRGSLHVPAPPPGPSKEEITTFLRKMDGRWARIGEWIVEDALEVLRKEDKVWCIGKGKWELCM
jgi:hypothetical protein